MIHNQQEYNEMLNDKARFEAEVAIQMDYENMPKQVPNALKNLKTEARA